MKILVKEKMPFLISFEIFVGNGAFAHYKFMQGFLIQRDNNSHPA